MKTQLTFQRLAPHRRPGQFLLCVLLPVSLGVAAEGLPKAAHDSPVMAVAFSADGKMLGSASRDRTVRLWSVPDGRLLHTLSDHPRRVEAIAFSPIDDLLASGDYGGVIKTWRSSDHSAVRSVRAHTRATTALRSKPEARP